jgi:hypothetical protein
MEIAAAMSAAADERSDAEGEHAEHRQVQPVPRTEVAGWFCEHT